MDGINYIQLYFPDIQIVIKVDQRQLPEIFAPNRSQAEGSALFGLYAVQRKHRGRLLRENEGSHPQNQMGVQMMRDRAVAQSDCALLFGSLI
jgi:hypothetical protein